MLLGDFGILWLMKIFVGNVRHSRPALERDAAGAVSEIRPAALSYLLTNTPSTRTPFTIGAERRRRELALGATALQIMLAI